MLCYVMSSFVKFWHRCPVRRQSSIVIFFVRSLRARSVIGCQVFRCCNTIPISQIVVYLGKDGLPKCPFKKSSHKGVSSKCVTIWKVKHGS